MADNIFLYMMLIGCKPKGRHTEQHDIYFGIGKNLKEASKGIDAAWPEAAGDIHIDAWRKVITLDDHEINIIPKEAKKPKSGLEVYFMNLGGYKPQEMEERHFKVLVVAENMQAAKKMAKQDSFFQTHVHPHIDDKFAIDVDDIFSVTELIEGQHPNLQLQINRGRENATEDSIQNGYFQLHLLKESW